MIALTLILAAILWVYCGVKAYLRVRSYYRGKYAYYRADIWMWTTEKRLACIAAACCGPIAMLAVYIAYENFNPVRKEAKW